MATSKAVETTELTVCYGDHVAVDRVTLSAEPGEILGLLGPNGAGKTSVIRALTTIVPVASGRAMVAGHPLTDRQAVRADIGVLPESNGYPTAQTAPSYLRYYGRLFGLSRAEADLRAGRLLERMGLGANRDRIGTFSRGMRQRLGLARALINEPAVVFLDEPTLGLDPAGQEDILAQLAATAVDEGTSVVLCSHLLDEVERVCDRVAIMDRARIVAEGTVAEVIATAGIGARGRIRVRPELVGEAERALAGCPAVADTTYDNTRPGDIDFDLALDMDLGTGSDADLQAGSGVDAGTNPAGRGRAPSTTTTILRTLLDAGIEPRSFDLEGARLSDAFLGLTRPVAA